MRHVLLAWALLSLAGCSSSYAPQPIVAGEVCAEDVQPPAYSSEEGGSNVVAPVALQRVDPHVDRTLIGSSAKATVSAIIGEDGVPRNICVVSGDPTWGRAVAAALRQWKFRPGTLDGKPVPVIFHLTTTFNG